MEFFSIKLLKYITDMIYFFQGSYVYDVNGKKYLDSLAGLWSTALGTCYWTMMITLHLPFILVGLHHLC